MKAAPSSVTLLVLAVTLSFSLLITSSTGKRIEVVKNGGFEDGLENWTPFSYYIEHDQPATINDSKSHFGKYSVDVGLLDVNQTRTGRGVRQTIQLPPVTNLNLSFWVYLGSVTGSENFGTDIALIIYYSTRMGPKTMVYNIAWDPKESIYYGFPQPDKKTENVTNILIPNMLPYRWTHIERNLIKDFKSAYPIVDPKTTTSMTIEFVAVRFQKIGFVVSALLDDVSASYETEGELTPWTSSTTEIPPSPTTQSTATTTSTLTTPAEKSTQQQALTGIDPNFVVLTAGLVIIAAAAIFFSLKKKREAPKAKENKTK